MSENAANPMILHHMKERLYRQLPVFSFEFFPPKTEAGEKSLNRALEELVELQPDYVSVTSGAGGSTRDKTKNLVIGIQKEFGLTVMAHLTCFGHTNDEIRRLLREYAENEIYNILALRGDPPLGQTEWKLVMDGPEYACDVVAMAKATGAFSIGVAGFPEKHPQASSIKEDLRHLKTKVDAGADFIITQLFFDNDLYFHYVKQARKIGVTVPIIPGIMPVTKAAQLPRFKELSRCYIPPALEESLRKRARSEEEEREIGLAYCASQCADLLCRGAPGIHFYTLNQSRACQTVHAALKAMGYWNR